MNTKLKIAVIGAAATLLAAGIAIVPPMLENSKPAKSKPTVSVSNSDRTAVVQGAGAVTINQGTTPQPADSAVRVVSASAEQSGLDVSTIDLKLRNVGDTSAYLKEASLQVVSSELLDRCTRCSGAPVRPTEIYDMSLGELKPKPISQAIAPRAVDRILIRVQASHFSQFGIYKVRVRLTYDEDDKVVLTDPFLITFGPYEWSMPAGAEFSCIDEAFWKTCTNKNRKATERIGYLRGK